MFKIRDEQVQAFELASLPAFEDYMVQHLAGFAQRHAHTLGEPGVRQGIQLGVANAAGYDLMLRGPVQLYIELMFIFGSGFDTDPQLPWASQVLTDSTIADERSRADRLYRASLDYHENVIGEDSKYARAAARGIHQDASAIYGFRNEKFAESMLQAMERIYPQKYERTDTAVLQALISSARELAASMKATTQRATALFVTCMFAFGHRFYDDPLYPWISGTLGNTKSIKDPDKRIDRLYEKINTYLGSMVQYLDQQ